MSTITLDVNKCVGCNSCVRVCPVSDANWAKKDEEGNLIIEIDESKCIKCGACIKACAHHARSFEYDTEEFLRELRSHLTATGVMPCSGYGIREWQESMMWHLEQTSVPGHISGI